MLCKTYQCTILIRQQFSGAFLTPNDQYISLKLSPFFVSQIGRFVFVHYTLYVDIEYFTCQVGYGFFRGKQFGQSANQVRFVGCRRFCSFLQRFGVFCKLKLENFKKQYLKKILIFFFEKY